MAPNELSYTDGGAWKEIYGHRRNGNAEEMGKDPIFRLHTPTGAQNILTADRDTHTRQRRLLSHAFSEAALREQETVLQLYANKLIDQLTTRCHDSTPAVIDMTAWLTFASFDLIGHMSFGENFGCLDSGEYAPFVRQISSMATELSFNQMWRYWGLFSLRQLFTPRRVVGQRMKNIGTAMAAVQRRMDRGSDIHHRDFLHYILAGLKDGAVDGSHEKHNASSNRGKEGKLSRAEINVNAFSLSIAGSESTATALCGALFLLLSHPRVYDTLVKEVRSAHSHDKTITLSSTHGLVYLDAVLSETLRLYPPVAISLPRCVPGSPGSKGVPILGSIVPSGTTVGMHPFATYRDPENFSEPTSFIPERWLSTENSTKQRQNRGDCFQPFSYGPRNCLGKNIAKAELRLLLCKLLFEFDWALSPGQKDWMEQQKVQGFWQKPSLYCSIQPAA